MKRGNPDKIKGQGFHTNPERINKNGRPKKLPELDVLLAEVLGDDHAKAILIAIRKKAKAGDVRAAELLLDRGYGKVKNPIDLIGEQVININVIRT